MSQPSVNALLSEIANWQIPIIPGLFLDDQPNRWIAEDCGIDHKTVAAKRDDLEEHGEIPHVNKFLGRNGQEYERPKPAPEPEEPDKIESVKLYSQQTYDTL